MKRFSAALTLFLVLSLLAASLVGCSGATEVELLFSDEKLVVFKVNSVNGNATLLDALNALKEQGDLDFEVQSGSYGAYITKVNGKSEVSYGTSGYSWMVYSNDADGSSTEFGMLSYQNETLGQTAAGVSTQTLKAGCIYALSYDRWAF